MAARFTVTRAEAIAAAASLYVGEKNLDAWADREYTNGIVQVLADAFGADVEDHDQAKDVIWGEIRAAFEHDNRRAEAERIAGEHIAAASSLAFFLAETLDDDGREDLRQALAAAALAGMKNA